MPEACNSLSLDDATDWLLRMASCDGLVSQAEVTLLTGFAQEHGLEAHALVKQARRFAAQVPPEVQGIDYKQHNGLAFEKHVVEYVAQSQGRLKLMGWTGDKFHQGVYDHKDLNPDLHISQQLAGWQAEYWVECKWRSHWMRDRESGQLVCDISAKQLGRYRALAHKWRYKVFLAIGIGGIGAAPRDMYVIPLKAMGTGRICKPDADRHYRIADSALAFEQRIAAQFTQP